MGRIVASDQADVDSFFAASRPWRPDPEGPPHPILVTLMHVSRAIDTLEIRTSSDLLGMQQVAQSATTALIASMSPSAHRVGPSSGAHPSPPLSSSRGSGRVAAGQGLSLTPNQRPSGRTLPPVYSVRLPAVH